MQPENVARRNTRKGALVYPNRTIEPEDLLHFVELKWFTKDWDDFGFNDEELGLLQIAIMCDPKRWPVIQGTDGLRKMRYSPSESARGQRGGLRVCYVYFERFFTVLLVVVYSKGEMDDLPQAAKRSIKSAITRIEYELERRFQT